MYCVHCGTEIPDDSRFCPSCGGEQPPVPGQGPTANDFLGGGASSQPGSGSSSSKPEDIIENAGESIGNSIDSALSDLKNSEGARMLKSGMNEAGKKAKDLKENWRDYLTLENMELVAPILLLMPLIMGIVRYAIVHVFALLFFIPFIGGIFRLILALIKLVFVVAAGAGVGAVGYVLYKKPEKRSLFSYIALGASCASLLSCVAMFFNWKYIPVICGLAALVWGAESISRVSIRKAGMEAQPDIQADLDAYKTFFTEFKDKLSKENARNQAGAQAGAQAGTQADAQAGAQADAQAGTQAAGFAAASGAAAGFSVDGVTGSADGVKGFDPNTAAGPAPVYQGQGSGESYFDGSGIECFGLLLLTAIVGAVTCGLATPWMLCKIFKWRKTHTVIDGRRLDFNGTGGNLFGHWILWELLTVVTCGIYGFFMFVAVRKWEMKHTFYQNQPEMAGSFDGNSLQYFGYGLLQVLLCMITCGIAGPWTITMIEKWQMKHSIVAYDRMRYDGTGLGLFGQYIIVMLLSVITCGIYLPWGIVRLDKYLFSNVHVDETTGM